MRALPFLCTSATASDYCSNYRIDPSYYRSTYPFYWWQCSIAIANTDRNRPSQTSHATTEYCANYRLYSSYYDQHFPSYAATCAIRITVQKKHEPPPAVVAKEDNKFECGICLDERQGGKLTCNVCKHTLCRDCHKKWTVDMKKTCPVCRRENTFHEVKYVHV